MTPRLFRPKKKKIYDKKFDFVPDKHQKIHGALLDLGRPIKQRPALNLAKQIADMYGEEI